MTLIEVAKNSSAVSKVSAWNDRHYVNLEGFNSRAAGDRNVKIWIKGDTLKIQGAKGHHSPTFLADLETLTADLIAAGFTRIAAYPCSPIEATFAIAQ